MRRIIALLILFVLIVPTLAAAQSTDCVASHIAPIPITPENADKLGIIDGIGRGYHFHIVWMGDQIFTGAESGWWRTSADLTAEPCRVLPPADVPETPDTAPDVIWNQIPADERDFTNVLGVSPSGNIWLTITTIFASDRSRTDVWNADGTLLYTLPVGGWRPYMHAAFNADESQMGIVSADGTITIYDVATGAELNLAGGWGGYSVAMAVSPSGNEIVLGNEEIARIWRLDRNTYGASLPGTYSAAFMPDGTVALPQDNAIRFYTSNDGREVRSLPTTFPMYGTEIAVNPNGNRIGLVHPEQGWNVIDAQTGSVLMSGAVQSFDGMTNSVDIAVANGYAVIGELDRLHVSAFDEPMDYTVDYPGYPVIAFSPDGRTLAASTADGLIRYPIDDMLTPRLLAAGIQAVDLAFSPDGRLIAAIGGGQLVLLDVESGAVLFNTEAYFGSLEFMPDGTRIITGDWLCYLCGSDESSQVSAAIVWGIVPD